MTTSVTRLTPAPRTSSTPARVQGTLALDLPAMPALPEPPELDPTRVARVEQVSEAEVRAWAARLAQAVVEVVGGRRPASQLVRWTSPAVHRDLDRRARLVTRASGGALAVPGRGAAQVRPQVRSVHVCRPSHDCAEVSVHVRYGARSRAIAMRLERSSGRWLCTVLELG